MDVFAACQVVNELLLSHNDSGARDELIRILDYCERDGVEYDPLVNHLIRQVGLYPYLKIENANWQDRFVFEAFKVDIGATDPVTLHREQSSILSKLISGHSLAVSAPTSFGKSFIIDSFISIKKPKNVVIIVPTIALTDETRRRLHSKFSRSYKIITTSEVELGERNIFIFPQERAIHYAEKIYELDMLVIDEFYKASANFDKERSPSLLNAILKLGKIAKQRYFLAPHIFGLNENLFTKDMEFLRIDFNTVYLEKHDLYKVIGRDENKKSDILVNILKKSEGKSLIYAGTYSNIDKVSNLILEDFDHCESELLENFEGWLIKNYDRNWHLTNLVKRSCGIHNGQLHRSLSQIQIKLFEENDGLKNIISTSSIIEGVNTSAENVIIWRNRNGQSKLNDFTFKNIIGRGGRMFRHFVGKIYILEKPPESEETSLDLDFPDSLVGDIDITDYSQELTKEQIAKIIAYKEEMEDILGPGNYEKLKKDGELESSDSFLIRDIAKEISENKDKWRGIGYLNSSDPDDWDSSLYRAIRLQPSGWGIEYKKFVGFIKILSNNWISSIPELLMELDYYDIGVGDFFKLERTATFKLSALLSDINTIQKHILGKDTSDISPFIAQVSHAFLPPVVYQLEEYGLPRMIAKKIHDSEVIDFEDEILKLHDVINSFNQLTFSGILKTVEELDEFDKYILKYFFEGISVDGVI